MKVNLLKSATKSCLLIGTLSFAVLVSCSKKAAPTPEINDANPASSSKPGAVAPQDKPNAELGNKTPEQALNEAMKIALETVYFGFDSFTLSADATVNLKNMASALKLHPEAKLGIEGHSDSRGSPEYNLALSEKRANAIKEFLVAEGVDANKLQVSGKGEEQPAVEGNSETAWSKNRRGEFRRL